MSDAPDRTETVFAAAVALEDPDERAAYLDQACAGDPALRGRVEALLRAHERAGHLLDRPAPVGPELTGAYTSGALPGTVLAGRYKLLEQIGEGGMGTVWVAEQTQPVRRKVALKLIKPGMDSKAVLARFEAERQALAVMDHPNIAKVLDGGATAAGRPFFVMEYVKGVPITEYCEAARLSVPQRLELFVQVCSAVQHAHQKGIIHRDLKPSNILVAPYDDKPVPKVIDFGLAKALHQPLTERTLHTAHETVLGTPLYMSPEQAQLNNLDVDTRSDVYSLGVLLYELLTGSTPLERRRFKEAAWEEVKRLIREEEPPKPSARLSSTDTLPSLAAGRQTEPARLTRLVRGELDWIVMKALEKDRSRRYQTASGFAADVQRHLAGEPVQAAPPGAGYRLRKLARRHRAALATAATVGLLLAAAAAVSTWQAVRASQQRQVAEANERQALAEQAKAEAAGRAADAAGQMALQALRATTDDAIANLIGSKPTLGPAERAYLESVLRRWQEFAAIQGDSDRARYYRGIGTGRVAVLLGRLGRREEAVARYREAARDLDVLATALRPDDPLYRAEWAVCHLNLGAVLAELQRYDAAEDESATAIAILGKLCAEHPDHRPYRNHLVAARMNLGLARAERGDWKGAEAAYRAAADLAEELVAAAPSDPDGRRHLGNLRNQLGNVATRTNRLAEAEASYREAIRHLEALVREGTGLPEHRSMLAKALANLGGVLFQEGKREEAERSCREALRVAAQLVADFPSVPSYRAHLVNAHTSLASLFKDLRRAADAEGEYKAAFDAVKRLIAEHPAEGHYQLQLGLLDANYGNFVLDQGRPADSLPWFQKAIDTVAPVLAKEPQQADARLWLFVAYHGQAEALHRLRRSAEALASWQKALEYAPPWQRPKTRARRAMTLAHAGRSAEAVAEAEDLLKAGGLGMGALYDFACVYAIASREAPAQQEERGRRAVEILRQAVRAGLNDVGHLKRDKDLDAVRGRQDFQQLLSDLEAGQAKGKQ